MKSGLVAVHVVQVGAVVGAKLTRNRRGKSLDRHYSQQIVVLSGITGIVPPAVCDSFL